MYTLTNPIAGTVGEAGKRAIFMRNSVDEAGGVQVAAQAGVAVGGFVAGKFLRGVLNQRIASFNMAAKTFGQTSIGDVLAALGTVVGARFVGAFVPDEYRGALEGGAFAAALHTIVAPYVPAALQGTDRYSPKAIGATYPTTPPPKNLSYADVDPADASAYNVAVSGPFAGHVTPFF